MVKKLLAIVLMAVMLASSALAWYPQGAGIQYNTYGTGFGGFGFSAGRNVQAMHWNTNSYGSPFYDRWQPYGGQYTGPSMMYSGPYSRVQPYRYNQVSYGGYGFGGNWMVNPGANRVVIY